MDNETLQKIGAAIKETLEKNNQEVTVENVLRFIMIGKPPAFKGKTIEEVFIANGKGNDIPKIVEYLTKK